MYSNNHRRAFSLVELMVVLAILGSLIVLLMPAIQAARESGRRTTCQNNLRQLGTALQGFESIRGRLPIGARRQVAWPSGLNTFGVSWYVDILPQIEETALADRLDKKGPYAGWVQMHPQNGRLVEGLVIRTFFCPSSPLPQLAVAGGYRVGMPSYVGISGAASGDGFVESRRSDCCHPKGDGEVTAGGTLFANDSIQLREIEDGTSHTMLVGETSDYAYQANGLPIRIDGGFPNGWLTGTVATGTPPNYDATRQPGAYNVTTIKHPIGSGDYDLPGVRDDKGANNPLLSAHPGGAMVLFADSSVQFMTETTELLTLKRMATRDDNSQVNH